jgi:hypothetical protein
MRRFIPLTVAAVLALAAAVALAADPGSKEDPLASVSYVTKLARFERVALPSNQAISLSPGTEFVVIEPPAELISLRGFDAKRDLLVNLSQGERVGGPAVAAYQHYLNGGTQPLAVSLASSATLLVRGEWR